jgi:hypothetical protein
VMRVKEKAAVFVLVCKGALSTCAGTTPQSGERAIWIHAEQANALSPLIVRGSQVNLEW